MSKGHVNGIYDQVCKKTDAQFQTPNIYKAAISIVSQNKNLFYWWWFQLSPEVVNNFWQHPSDIEFIFHVPLLTFSNSWPKCHVMNFIRLSTSREREKQGVKWKLFSVQW